MKGKMVRDATCTMVKRTYLVPFLYHEQNKVVDKDVLIEEIIYQHDVHKQGKVRWWRGARICSTA